MTNKYWWQFEPEEAAQKRKSEFFKQHADIPSDQWRWQKALIDLPPVGEAASTFVDLSLQPEVDAWQQALSQPAQLSSSVDIGRLPPSLPSPPTPSPTAPPPPSKRDWTTAFTETVGAGLGTVGEAVGAGLGYLGEQLEENRRRQQAPATLPDWMPSWVTSGLAETTPALAARAGVLGEKAKKEVEALEVPPEVSEQYNPLEKAGELAVSFIADPITYLSFGIGGLVGKAAFKGATKVLPKLGEAVVSQGIGMGGISAAHSPLQQVIDAGNVEFGRTAEDIARGVATGAAFGVVGAGAGAALSKASPLVRKVGQLATEITSMGAIPAGMEGRLPTVDDFIIGAGAVAGMKAPKLVGRALHKLSGGRAADLTPEETKALANVTPEQRVGVLGKIRERMGELRVSERGEIRFPGGAERIEPPIGKRVVFLNGREAVFDPRDNPALIAEVIPPDATSRDVKLLRQKTAIDNLLFSDKYREALDTRADELLLLLQDPKHDRRLDGEADRLVLEINQVPVLKGEAGNEYYPYTVGAALDAWSKDGSLYTMTEAALAKKVKAVLAEAEKAAKGNDDIPQLEEKNTAGRKVVTYQEMLLDKAKRLYAGYMADYEVRQAKGEGEEGATISSNLAFSILSNLAKEVEASKLAKGGLLEAGESISKDVPILDFAKALDVNPESTEFGNIIHKLVNSGEAAIHGARGIPKKSIYLNPDTKETFIMGKSTSGLTGNEIIITSIEPTTIEHIQTGKHTDEAVAQKARAGGHDAVVHREGTGDTFEVVDLRWEIDPAIIERIVKSGAYDEAEVRRMSPEELQDALEDTAEIERRAAAPPPPGGEGLPPPPPPGPGPTEPPIGGRRRPQNSTEWDEWLSANYPDYKGRLDRDELYTADTGKLSAGLTPEGEELYMALLESRIDSIRELAKEGGVSVADVQRRAEEMIRDPKSIHALLAKLASTKPHGILDATEAEAVKALSGVAVSHMLELQREVARERQKNHPPGSPEALNLDRLIRDLSITEDRALTYITKGMSSASAWGLAMRMRQEVTNQPIDWASSPEAALIKSFELSIKKLGNIPAMKDILSQITRMAEEGDFKGIYKLIRSLDRMTPEEMLFKFWVSNVLSNIGTGITNFTSTLALGTARQLGVRPLVPLTQKLLVPGTRYTKEQQQKAALGEMRVVVKALDPRVWRKQTAWHRGISTFLHVMAEGFTEKAAADLDLKTKFNVGFKEFTGEHYDPMRERFVDDTFRDRVGSVLRPWNYVTRLLTATDQMLKVVMYEAELNALAYREAVKVVPDRSARPAEFVKAYEEASANPELVKQATDLSKVATMTNDPGQLGSRMLKVRDAMPGGKYLMPFVTIITHMMEHGLKLSPLGYGKFVWDWQPFGREELKGTSVQGRPGYTKMRDGKVVKGNPGDMQWKVVGSSPQAAQSLAEAIIGSGVMGLGMTLYQSKILTGAPPETQAERDAWYKLYQPYSVKVGDKWVSYQFLYPVAFPFMMAATLGDLIDDPRHKYTDKGIPEKAAVAAQLIGKAVLDVPMLTALANVMDAVLNQMPGAAEKMAADVLGGFVPASSLLRRGSRIIDPMLKDPKNFWERIMANLPALSQMVPDRLDVYGNPVEREEISGAAGAGAPPGGLGKLSAFSPTPISITDENSKVSRLTVELQRLGVSPGFVGKALMLSDTPEDPNFPKKKPTPLTRDQQREYQMVAGRLMFNGLDALVGGPTYNKLSDKQKYDRIKSVMGAAKDEAQRLLFLSPPPLVAMRESLARRTYQKSWDALGPGEQLKLSMLPEYTKAQFASVGQRDRPISMVSSTALGQDIQYQLSGPVQTELQKYGVQVGAVNRSISSTAGRKYYLDDTLFGHYQSFVHDALQYYLGQVLASKSWKRPSDRMTEEQRRKLLSQVVSAAKMAAGQRVLQEAVATKGVRAVYGSSLPK